MNLFVNNIIEYRDENAKLISCERVLWISRVNNAVVTISIIDKNALPVFKKIDDLERDLSEFKSRKLDFDPYDRFMVPDEKLTPNEIKIRDNAWSYIKDIVELEPNIFDPKERFEHIKLICTSYNIGKKFLYKYLRYYWMGGKKVNALLPRFRKCGGQGKRKNPEKKMGRPRKTIEIHEEYSGVNVTKPIRNIFDAAIKEFYNNRRRDSVKFAYIKMLSQYFQIETTIKNGVEIPIIPPDYKLPSIAQFRYYLRTKQNPRKTIISREGEVNFERDMRPVLGSETRRAAGPGQIFEVDATVADVYLVSSDDPNQIIGRPVVYMVVDVWSHMVVGIYVGLEGPSWQGMMMAIENTAADKVQFCEEYGIRIKEEEWPCHYLPEYFYADRGEMESKNADSLANALGIKIKNTPPYRPDLKGIVEQKFRTVNLTLQPWMPGAVKKEYLKRGGPDYVLDAKLTLKGFTSMLIEMVLHKNNYHFMHHYPLDKALSIDKVNPIPKDLWMWGIAHDHYLKEIPLDIVRLNVLPEAKVTANHEGIYFQGMYYGSDTLVQQGWFIRGKSIRVSIAYDRRCMNHIYIKIDNGKRFIKCPLLEKSSRYRNLSLEEIKEKQHEESIRSSLYLSTELQSEVELHAKLDAIVNKEVKKAEQEIDVTMTKEQRKANIKKNKKHERNKNRKEQYFELDKEQETIESLDTNEQSNEMSEIYIPKSKFSLLQKINKGVVDNG